ncbi:hypothetical protein [Botrimarina hoheduenensis]|uniref:Uncharacterized protein n=1 Tax=Botrimarina hoheduenensis TaxID=2528000 RepID=A0A5C5W8X1_9BACT|nr:hypothetical protein [Botrimarina hoheduenensis]TWT46479.1 hypothetical protein Pla111_15750 [Botrimarina hoheduenensis]
MDRQFSKNVQRKIRDFYDNREAVGLQRLQELVTELYLAEGKKREKTWGMIEAALKKTGMKEDRIAHLRQQDDPQLLAKVVAELMAQ